MWTKRGSSTTNKPENTRGEEEIIIVKQNLNNTGAESCTRGVEETWIWDMAGKVGFTHPMASPSLNQTWQQSTETQVGCAVCGRRLWVHTRHFAWSINSAYRGSGILRTMRAARAIVSFASSGGKDRRILFGLDSLKERVRWIDYWLIGWNEWNQSRRSRKSLEEWERRIDVTGQLKNGPRFWLAGSKINGGGKKENMAKGWYVLRAFEEGVSHQYQLRHDAEDVEMWPISK